MSTTNYKNISKKAFEALLYNINANQPLGYHKHFERNWGCGSDKPIHLYYDRKDRHLGTWHDGNCWTFTEVTDDLMMKENRQK
jgi:hypothetical protein